MDKDTLPQMDNDHNEDTVQHDPQRTRPTETLPKTAATSQNIPPVRAQPPPRGGHVQPLPGQQPRRAPQARNRRHPPRRTKSADKNSLYLPWWSLAFMLIGVLVVTFGLVAAVFLLGNPTGIVAEPTPIIRIITAQPTAQPQVIQPTAAAPSTQIISGGDAPSNLQLQGPTLEAIQFTPTPIPITVSQTVYVEGVDEDKLNVRSAADLNASDNILFRAAEAEQFVVVEGPLQADGFTWWRIQDPVNTARAGWAVSNFLSVTPGD